MTKTNSTTFTDAEIVLYANMVKDELAEEIANECGEGYFDVHGVRDLEAGVRNYTFDNDMLKHLRYASAKLDGTNLVYLRETDFSLAERNNLPLLDNTTVKNLYASRNPEYFISGVEFYILSGDDIIDVTEGIDLVYEAYPEDLTTSDLAAASDLSIPSSNQAVRLPRAAHKVWLKLVSIAYKSSQEKPIPLTEDEQKIEIDRSKMYDILRGRNQMRSFSAAVPYNDGQDY